MAPAAGTATTTRTPNKSGTKKPRGTVEADARGGKTTSVCEAPAQGSEPITPRVFLGLYHEQALVQIDACQGLLSRAKMLFDGPEDGYDTEWVGHAQDWIENGGRIYAWRLRGEYEALRRLALHHDREDALMPAHEAVEAMLTDARLTRALPAPAWSDPDSPNAHEAAYELCVEARNQWDKTRYVPVEGPPRRFMLAGRDFLDWWRSKVGEATPKDIMNALVKEYRAALLDLGGADSDGPPPPDLSHKRDAEQDDQTVEAALTANDAEVVRTMARPDASLLLSIKAIVEEMDPHKRLSEESVRTIVKKLICLKLATRPTDRGGARLTAEGRKVAGKIAD